MTIPEWIGSVNAIKIAKAWHASVCFEYQGAEHTVRAKGDTLEDTLLVAIAQATLHREGKT